MIIVAGEVRFAAGEIARLKDVLLRTIAATRAEEGCEHYAYAIDLGDSDILHVTERWRDEASLDAHMTTAHMVELGRVLEQARIEMISIRAYEAGDPRTLVGA